MSSSTFPHSDESKRGSVSSGCGLLTIERFWVQHQKWLESCGYLLRPRYRPGWIPSWKGTNKFSLACEDSRFLSVGRLMDATRISDGTIVAIKKISLSRSPDEVDINRFLSIPEEDDVFLMIMPFVRPYDNPRFETIGEAVEFFRQIFEGLQFMHEHRIAHRDCCRGNIMMEATRLYPNGHHPVDLDLNRNYRGKAKHYTRTERPPKYYLVDFGISLRFESEGRPLAKPIRGRDKTVPEFQGEIYYEPSDPFPTDIYYLGNLIKTYFADVNFGFEFMSPLIADMTQVTPSQRPTIDEVVSRFDTVYRSLSRSKLRSRIIQREPDLFTWWRGSVHFFRNIRYILQRIPPVPQAANTKRTYRSQPPHRTAESSGHDNNNLPWDGDSVPEVDSNTA